MDGDRAAPHPPARPAGQHGAQYTPPVAGASEPAVAVALMALVAVIAVVLPAAGAHVGVVHQIPEGHVGVYWRGGALLKHVTEPGYHLLLPFITTYEPIQVTLQTDQVTNIPCGTKGGVMIYFDKIEVVNRLRHGYVYETIKQYGVNYDKTWIYDKIHHEINQFCSAHTLQQVYIDLFDQIDEKVKEAIMRDLVQYAPGIEIIGVRVTKPKIPPVIARNYEQMEEERTKVLIAMERQKVVEKEAETEKKRAVSEAEMAAQVSRVLMEQRVREKESQQRQQQIDDEVFVAREKALADAHHYRVMREAEANSALLTAPFLELKFIEALANNTKLFFGDKRFIEALANNTKLFFGDKVGA
ncbi:unnamed protein product [Closterium sp. NIES-64]|nr:unnamed protein product [Closterium sp. NIES-64]CAI6007065.1 unnamed protein product [Closterium sp. NIES-65]